VHGHSEDIGDVDNAIRYKVVAWIIGSVSKDGVEEHGVDIVKVDKAVTIEIVAYTGRCSIFYGIDVE
jgi:hypothetical protein